MAIIGKFKRTGDNTFEGFIETRLWNCKATIKEAEARPTENYPPYIVFAGGLEIGAAWGWHSDKNTPYLSVKIDDPSFESPIDCRFNEEHDSYDLIWYRK